ncbi:unnamed protein product, partial [Rotaria sp. Silwood2]
DILKNFDHRYGIIYRRLKNRSRRTFFLCILGTTIILYLLSKWIPHRFLVDLLVHYNQCLQTRLEQFSNDILNMNAIINHEPIQYGEIVSLPFTG